MSTMWMVRCKSPVADNGRDPRELVRNGWARSVPAILPGRKPGRHARRAMLPIIAIAHYSAAIFFIYQYMHYVYLYPLPS